MAFKYGTINSGKRLHIVQPGFRATKSWCGRKLDNLKFIAEDEILCERCLAALSRYVEVTRWKFRQIRHFSK